MNKHIPTYEEFINESSIEIVYYEETIDNWGRKESSKKPAEIERLLKTPDEWSDDQTFEDKLGKVYFIDDLIGKDVKVNGRTFKVTESVNESSKRGDGKIYFHELSDIDHTRLIKWMGQNLDSKIEDYDFVKGGKLKTDAWTLETSKMKERDLKDLLNYLDSQDYKFSTTIWLPAYIKESVNEAKKSITQLATELVEIAASYVDVDMTPEMHAAQSIEDEDQLTEFFDELVDTVAEDAAGPDITKFKKEAISFLKKYGVTI